MLLPLAHLMSVHHHWPPFSHLQTHFSRSLSSPTKHQRTSCCSSEPDSRKNSWFQIACQMSAAVQWDTAAPHVMDSFSYCWVFITNPSVAPLWKYRRPLGPSALRAKLLSHLFSFEKLNSAAELHPLQLPLFQARFYFNCPKIYSPCLPSAARKHQTAATADAVFCFSVLLGFSSDWPQWVTRRGCYLCKQDIGCDASPQFSEDLTQLLAGCSRTHSSPAAADCWHRSSLLS